MEYTNPRTQVQIDDYPYGYNLRTSATFTVESHPQRGERAVRVTVDPNLGRANAPHKLTYARRVCFVDGDDGRLYILEDTATHVSIMKSNMAHKHATVYPDSPEYHALTALMDARDTQPTTTEETEPMPAPTSPTTDAVAQAMAILDKAYGATRGTRKPVPAPEEPPATDARPEPMPEGAPTTDALPESTPGPADAPTDQASGPALTPRQYGFLDGLALDGVYTLCPNKVRAAFVKKGLTTDMRDNTTVTALGQSALRAYVSTHRA